MLIGKYGNFFIFFASNVISSPPLETKNFIVEPVKYLTIEYYYKEFFMYTLNINTNKSISSNNTSP